MTRIKFLNTKIDNLTFDEAIERATNLINKRTPSYVVTPNVDHIIKLESDQEFKNVYDDADLILTDGKPLIWISKWLGTPIKGKISGSDFFPAICEVAANQDFSVYLLGAAEGVANVAAEKLQKKYPGLKIAGVYSPPFGFDQDSAEVDKIIKNIRLKNPDILAVGLGAPKQEKFIHRYYKKMGVPLSLAIGASIDFEAGSVKRAPRWLSDHGFEWLYRLLKEPKRMFKRYIIDDFKIIDVFLRYRKRK